MAALQPGDLGLLSQRYTRENFSGTVKSNNICLDRRVLMLRFDFSGLLVHNSLFPMGTPLKHSGNRKILKIQAESVSKSMLLKLVLCEQ